MNIDKFLLDQGGEVYSYYQTEDLEESASLIAKLAFDETESPSKNRFRIDVSQIKEMFPVVSEFKLEDSEIIRFDTPIDKVMMRQCNCRNQSTLKEELMVLSKKYSKVLRQNIELKEKMDAQQMITEKDESQINKMLQQQLIRVLDENKILSIDNQNLRKRLDNLSQLQPHLKLLTHPFSNQNKDTNTIENINKTVKYYTITISQLSKQNSQLKDEIKQISSILTNQLLKVSKLESKLQDQKIMYEELRSYVFRKESPTRSVSRSEGESKQGLGSLSRIREIVDLKSGIRGNTPNTELRELPIEEFNLEEMLKISN